MAIRVHLDEVLRERGMTAKELCAKVGITEANLSIPVSYTHLDVYKRQATGRRTRS